MMVTGGIMLRRMNDPVVPVKPAGSGVQGLWGTIRQQVAWGFPDWTPNLTRPLGNNLDSRGFSLLLSSTTSEANPWNTAVDSCITPFSENAKIVNHETYESSE